MITLPADCATVLSEVVTPALGALPATYGGIPAELELLAIGMQESGYQTRTQTGGPARGLWQFEAPICGLLLIDPVVGTDVQAAAKAAGVAGTGPALYAALTTNDVFACQLARLLLGTSSTPIPAVGQLGPAWTLYSRLWRPGKPRPTAWTGCYRLALQAVSAPPPAPAGTPTAAPAAT